MMSTQEVLRSQKPLRSVVKKSSRSRRDVKNSTFGALVWALDPGVKKSQELRNTARLIALWRTASPSPLLPVSTLSPLEIGWPEGAARTIARTNPKAAVSHLIDVLAALQVKEAPKVLVREAPSVEASVQAVIGYAKKEKASAIVVSTSGRSGLRRLGSFTERIVCESPIPVLSLNPKSRIPKRVSKILFATDLSHESKKLFMKVLELALRHRAEITIMFQSEHYVSAYLADGSADPSVLKAYADLQRMRRADGIDWAQEAKDLGVNAEFVFSRKSETTANAIIRIAKLRRSHLIVLGSHRNRFAKLILGSTVRQVMTKAIQPVFVFPDVGRF